MIPPSQDAGLPDAVRARFRADFGADPAGVFFAPGRVNLIGTHLDYNGGDVLPLAVDLGIYVAATLRDDDRVRLVSLDEAITVTTTLAGIGTTRRPEDGWAGYPLGVLAEFLAESALPGGVDLVFGGDVPMASGMSSSAALEVATATAVTALTGASMSAEALARLCHRAENRYVGVRCGIMDQFASALGRAGHALLLHCVDQSWEHVEIHGGGFDVLVVDTRKPRSLAADGVFNDRVRECAEAHAVLRESVRDLPALASYTPGDLEAAGERLSGVLLRRARHVVTEMERVREAVQDLRDGRADLFGAALTASHRSASRDLQVSCDELDHVVEAGSAAAGGFGARLTGAGFGGCAIVLTETGRGEEVAAQVRASYTARFGVEPGFMLLHAGGGPRRVA